MTTTMYLSMREVPIAARALRALGYNVTGAALRAGDRYVMNVAERFEPMDLSAREELTRAIVRVVRQHRAR